MHGVINLLKPPGMTSHDAVGLVRRLCGTRRVGHTGTLDPAAAGVLPICIGQATRLVENLQAGRKAYVAEFTFGHETDTFDAMGRVLHQGSTEGVNLENLRAALDPWRGRVQQIPPIHSAIKRDGKKLYELARAGGTEEEIAPAARDVVIHELEVQHFISGATPRAMVYIECGSGTYIRSLVRDVGRALGCGATMTFLVRERSGVFDINEAFTVEQLTENSAAAIIPLADALGWCARVKVTNDEAVRGFGYGQIVDYDIAGHGSKVDATGNSVAADQADAANRRSASDKWSEPPDDLVLFMSTDRQRAALATPVAPGQNLYRAAKVFNIADEAA